MTTLTPDSASFAIATGSTTSPRTVDLHPLSPYDMDQRVVAVMFCGSFAAVPTGSLYTVVSVR